MAIFTFILSIVFSFTMASGLQQAGQSEVEVSAWDQGVKISVYLDQPLPEHLEVRAGFNLEFIPSAYIKRTYLADGKPGIFPLYPSSTTSVEPISTKIPQFAGHTTFDDKERGEYIVTKALATGKTLALAPEYPERVISIHSEDGDLMLFDGRNQAQNGWFIVRSLLPAKWRNQALGPYLRYNYVKFDFSSVKDPGLYYIQYGEQKINTFPIATDVYHEIWHPTLDVWFPVQMDHMQVNEAYRVWHGVPFLDDALQAPINHQHFDGYSMGDTTDTRFKPFEHIPGLTHGGWFDAGDFDIQTGSHCHAVLSLVEAWEKFNPDRDETYVDYASRYVDIHRPDGRPDILQQIEHGTLTLVAQVENIGHLGDASTETNQLPYNPDLKPYQSDGISSGTMNDRWAFTTRSSYLDYQIVAALAAAHRALKGYNNTLAEECLFYA